MDGFRYLQGTVLTRMLKTVISFAFLFMIVYARGMSRMCQEIGLELFNFRR